MKLVQPLKWHGGKSYIARRIVALMPTHLHYVEPYAGGLAVLLEKDPEGVSEVVNDINGDLMNFWTVLRNPDLFPVFQRACEATPFSEELWKLVVESLEKNNGQSDTFLAQCEPVRRAWMFFVRCRQSLAGRMKNFAPLSRTRTRRGMNEQASAWLGAVEGLSDVHNRLKRVVILNHDALDVIREQDGEKTLCYADPPYLHETRVSKDAYSHEMTAEQHRELLSVLTTLKGKFILSGYRSKLYDDFAAVHGWHRKDYDLPNHAAGGDSKRRMVESCWCNFKPEVSE